MRGAPGWHCESDPDRRIIPADAGSTYPVVDYVASIGDHPRGCGEHLTHPASSMSQVGSSPRMRGAQLYASLDDLRQRIIPADAGSTRRCRGSPAIRKDHPRGCGEHLTYNWNSPFERGSSPRMRGAPSCRYYLPSGSWIIPADAGSTMKLYTASLA